MCIMLDKIWYNKYFKKIKSYITMFVRGYLVTTKLFMGFKYPYYLKPPQIFTTVWRSKLELHLTAFLKTNPPRIPKDFIAYYLNW